MIEEPTIQLTLTLYETDPLVKVLQAELPSHSTTCSIRRQEVVHYSASGGSHWMSVITTTVTVGGIRWLSQRLHEMFGNTVRIEVTRDSCSVTGRTQEQINAATEAAVTLMKEMQAMSGEKRRKKPAKQKGSE